MTLHIHRKSHFIKSYKQLYVLVAIKTTQIFIRPHASVQMWLKRCNSLFCQLNFILVKFPREVCEVATQTFVAQVLQWQVKMECNSICLWKHGPNLWEMGNVFSCWYWFIFFQMVQVITFPFLESPKLRCKYRFSDTNEK